MELEHQIEELISQGAKDFEISKLIKSHIKDYLSSLDELFQKTQGKDFLVKHTRKIDIFMKTIFKYTIRQYFGNYMPLYNAIPLTIVAMGSYGREELCVYSDIDLMFVYKDVKGYNIEPIIESMLYLAWDAGIKMGHRTHKVEELLSASNEDLTIKTALIESRFLYGSKMLWIETQRELLRIRRDNPKEFLSKKIEAYENRGKSYPLNMEPNIKDGVGGLRDANTLFWVSNILHGTTKIRDLVPKFLSEEEFKELRMALEFLFRVRSALHLSAGKKQDILNLEYIPDVAARLGFKDKKLKNAQTRLAQKTLQSLWTLKTTCQIYIKRLTAPLFYEKTDISLLKNLRQPSGLYLINDVLYAPFHKSPKDIEDVLEEMLQLPDIAMKFDISVIHYLRHTNIPNHNSPKVYMRLKSFLYRLHVNQFFYAFYKAGFLKKLIKPMGHTINLPQFDGYHNYPVDIHSLKCLWHLENIKDNFINALFKDLCPDGQAMLRLTVLLHDVGKGRKTDHSELGAKLIKSFAKKLNLSENAINMATLLVKHHTLMSNTANRQDIYNEKVIFTFASTIKSEQALKVLYILTYCDVNGVSDKAYSKFSAKLLRELYTFTLEALDKNDLVDEASRRRRKERLLEKNSNFKSLSNIQKKKILNIPSTLFFLKHKTHEIFDIASWAFTLKEYDSRIINDEHLSISVIRRNDFNVGYFLSKLVFLDLANMDIFKLYDEIKYFKMDFNQAIANEDIEYVKNLIDQSFDTKKEINLKKPIIKKDEITFDYEHSQTYAQVSLNAKDQPGLMAYINTLFDKYGIDISSAKIQTIKNRARNLFLIEKQPNLRHNVELILKELYESES